tara:strand:- start:1237 stop:1434 length:198 start_codon:yes stop_codon:yes gene_type:complete
MQINEQSKQIIREIVVELFKEVASKQTFGVNDEVLQLDEHLHDWVGAKIDKYDVKVYGARLQEKY